MAALLNEALELPAKGFQIGEFALDFEQMLLGNDVDLAAGAASVVGKF